MDASALIYLVEAGEPFAARVRRELGALLERAARENLAPKAIKASIRSWRPDPYRT